MRVLLISHTCQSVSEGQPKARLLARSPGVELKVLTPDRWRHYGRPRTPEVPPEHAAFMHVGRVRWPWLGPAQSYLHWYPGLSRLLRTFRPDVIDLWEEPWALVSVQACRLRDRLLPEARIISETEQNIDKRLPPPFERFRRYTLGRAQMAVGRSREAVAVLHRKGYAGPAEVVPNAVDAERFQPLDAAARRTARAALGLSGFVVGYVGRFVEEKGIDDLVAALSHCPGDVSALFVGAGPLNPARSQSLPPRGRPGGGVSDDQCVMSKSRAPGATVHALPQPIPGGGGQERLRILPQQPPDELCRTINALDVLVLPSRTTPRWKEQFGRVIIEAHACGVPVIGSDSGAIPEVVGEGGLIVPERDPAALARAILRLRDDPALRHKLSRIGRERVEALYTWRRVADQMVGIYRRVTGREAHGGMAPRSPFRGEGGKKDSRRNIKP